MYDMRKVVLPVDVHGGGTTSTYRSSRVCIALRRVFVKTLFKRYKNEYEMA